MKSNVIFFLGLFAALGISWAGIVLGSNAQLGALAPFYDETEGSTYPQWMPGAAAQGQLVYRDLGCYACHTQQVRRPGFGSDQERGWGDRQSVARDYIYQPAPQLGWSRVGPDLTNLADRKPSAPDAEDLLHMLYAGTDGMPAYRFLFETRQLGAGAQPSQDALKLTGALEPAAGWEIVPTPRSEALVAYLLSLKTTYTYPEAVPFAPPKAEGSPSAAAPAGPAATAPAPAPTSTAAKAGPAPVATATATPASTPAAATPPPANAASPAPAASVSPTPSPTGPATPPTPSPSATALPAGTGGTPSVAASPAEPAAAAPAAAAAAGSPAPVATAPATHAAPAAGVSPTPSPTGPATPPTPSPPATAVPANTGATK